MGCALLLGLIMGSAGLLAALASGYPSWVVQQAIMFLAAFGILPLVNRIPVISRLGDDVDRLALVYRNNPHLLTPGYLLIRFLPMVNYLILWREVRTMLVIILIGLPLDIGLEVLETYVLNLPSWGQAAVTPFWGRIAMQTGFTLGYTPYLVMIAIALKGAKERPGRRPDIQHDLFYLQGRWNLVAMVQNGVAVSDQQLHMSVLVFEGSQLTFMNTARTVAKRQMNFSLDQTQNPRTIDLVGRDARAGETLGLGIYQLEGNKLWLALFNGPDARRPARFESQPGSGISLIALEKAR